jgi:hypothetical protein
MARRAPINGRAATIDVLRHMGRHLHRPQIIDEVLCVIGLVGTQRDGLWPIGEGFDHLQRRDPFSISAGLRQAGIDQQAIAVFHKPMPHEAQLGLLAFALPIKSCIWVGR